MNINFSTQESTTELIALRAYDHFPRDANYTLKSYYDLFYSHCLGEKINLNLILSRLPVGAGIRGHHSRHPFEDDHDLMDEAIESRFGFGDQSPTVELLSDDEIISTAYETFLFATMIGV